MTVIVADGVTELVRLSGGQGRWIKKAAMAVLAAVAVIAAAVNGNSKTVSYLRFMFRYRERGARKRWRVVRFCKKSVRLNSGSSDELDLRVVSSDSCMNCDMRFN